MALPENVVGEIIDGVQHTQARPGPKHSIASSRAGERLNLACGRHRQRPDGPGGWWIVDEAEVVFGPNVLVPDIAGWRHSPMPRLPETAQFTITPDWVCEVVSLGTARKDRVRKLPKIRGSVRRLGVPHRPDCAHDRGVRERRRPLDLGGNP